MERILNSSNVLAVPINCKPLSAYRDPMFARWFGFAFLTGQPTVFVVKIEDLIEFQWNYKLAIHI